MLPLSWSSLSKNSEKEAAFSPVSRYKLTLKQTNKLEREVGNNRRFDKRPGRLRRNENDGNF